MLEMLIQGFVTIVGITVILAAIVGNNSKLE